MQGGAAGGRRGDETKMARGESDKRGRERERGKERHRKARNRGADIDSRNPTRTPRKTERQKDRRTERQKDRKIERQTERADGTER